MSIWVCNSQETPMARRHGLSRPERVAVRGGSLDNFKGSNSP